MCRVTEVHTGRGGGTRASGGSCLPCTPQLRADEPVYSFCTMVVLKKRFLVRLNCGPRCPFCVPRPRAGGAPTRLELLGRSRGGGFFYPPRARPDTRRAGHAGCWLRKSEITRAGGLYAQRVADVSKKIVHVDNCSHRFSSPSRVSEVGVVKVGCVPLFGCATVTVLEF